MGQKTQALVLALAAGLTGLAVGRIHQEWRRDETTLLRRFDPLSDPGVVYRRPDPVLRPLDPGVVVTPRLPTPPVPPVPPKLPTPPVPVPPKDPVSVAVKDPVPIPPVPPIPAVPKDPSDPGPVAVLPKDPPPPSANPDDARIASLLTEARRALETGKLETARHRAAMAGTLKGSPERIAEAKRQEAFAEMAVSLLPEAERWADLYDGEWLVLQTPGRAIEGKLLRETDAEFTIGLKPASKATFRKADMTGGAKKIPAAQLRARFEGEAREKASKAQESEEPGIGLYRAARFAWEMNLPTVALELLQKAGTEDPNLSKAVYDSEASRHLALGAWYMAVNKDKAREEFRKVMKDFKDSPSCEEAQRLLAKLDEPPPPTAVTIVMPGDPPPPPPVSKNPPTPVTPAPPIVEDPKLPGVEEPAPPNPGKRPPDRVRPPDGKRPPPRKDPAPESDIVVSPVNHRSTVSEAVEADRLYASAISALQASPPGTRGFQQANREALGKLTQARGLYETAAGKDGAHSAALRQMIQHVNMCIYGCKKSSNIF